MAYQAQGLLSGKVVMMYTGNSALSEPDWFCLTGNYPAGFWVRGFEDKLVICSFANPEQ